MATVKEFKKELKEFGSSNTEDLPQRIREVVNQDECTAYLKAILIGALLVLDHEIELIDYRTYTDVGQIPTRIIVAGTDEILI